MQKKKKKKSTHSTWGKVKEAVIPQWAKITCMSRVCLLSPRVSPFWAKLHLWTFVYTDAWVGYGRDQQEKKKMLSHPPTYVYNNMYICTGSAVLAPRSASTMPAAVVFCHSSALRALENMPYSRLRRVYALLMLISTADVVQCTETNTREKKLSTSNILVRCQQWKAMLVIVQAAVMSIHQAQLECPSGALSSSVWLFTELHNGAPHRLATHPGC